MKGPIAAQVGKQVLAGLGLGLMLGVGAGVNADTISWDGDGGVGGDWFTDANWNGDAKPTAADDVKIAEASASSADNRIVIAGQPAAVNSLQFGYSAISTGGYLSIQDDLTITGTFSSYRGSMDVEHTAGDVTAGNIFFGERETPHSRYRISGDATLSVSGTTKLGSGYNGSSVEFIQDGGTVTLTDEARVGEGTAGDTGSFLYDMSAGTLNAGSFIVGWKSKGNHFRQSGGTATFAEFSVANDFNDPGTGKLTLQDAARFTVTGNVQIGGGGGGEDGGGVATAVLDGSRTGAGTNLIVANSGNFTLKTESTIRAIIDAAAIADTTAMRMIDVSGTVTFQDGALLDVLFDAGVAPAPGTWTLVSSEGSLTDAGLAFASGVDTSLWSFSTDGQQLTITYIPEPASLALLGLGGAMVLFNRRK